MADQNERAIGAGGAQAVRLGDFDFEPESGRLVDRRDGSLRRLAPQPSLLLGLLIEADGALVPRDEIRARIWGDTVLDFDQALHFCVRQVRSALGDDASAPRYVENVPRRGYRLLTDIDAPAANELGPGAVPVEGGDEDEDTVAAASGSGRRGRRLAVGLCALALGLLALTAMALRFIEPTAPRVPKVAILAFAPSAAIDRAAPTAADTGLRIANLVLDRLADAGAEALGVIGPSTTAIYGHGFEAARRAVRELGVDLVLLGRWLPNEGAPPDLIVELIRATDGVHLWVERYRPPIDVETVVDEASAATLDTARTAVDDR